MKKILMMLMLIWASFALTGCFKRDNMDDITIYTTSYPIEYLVYQIYGYNSQIDSIYPNGTDITTYELTKKQVKEYATMDMFVYNRLTNEQELAADFLNYNHNLKVIDVAKGISLQHDTEELWLCPSNYLMLAQNIKNELIEYVKNKVLKQEIEDKYEDLKLLISTYDAELKMIAENASNRTIIAGNDVFTFLTKYGFEVLSVEETDSLEPTDLQEAKNNIAAKRNSYVFILTGDGITENVQKLKNAGATIVEINPGTILTDEEVNEGYNYQNIMDDFIEKLQNEVYK